MRKLVRLQQHRDAFAAEGSSAPGAPGPYELVESDRLKLRIHKDKQHREATGRTLPQPRNPLAEADAAHASTSRVVITRDEWARATDGGGATG